MRPARRRSPAKAGARDGCGSTWSTPKAWAARAKAAIQEQLFALGYATCFNGAVLFAAAQKKVDASKARVTCEVDIGPKEGGGFALQARLKIHVPGLSREQQQELIEAAHQICPYSNATRGNMPVDLVVEA